MSEEPIVNTQSNRRNKPRFLRVILVFFSILILVSVFAVLLWNNFSTYSEERLYLEIVQNDLTGTPEDWHDFLPASRPFYHDVREAFNQSDFEKASLRLTEILRTQKENDTLACLMGITHLELGHTDTAVFWLEKVVRNNQPGTLLERAQLLLGLSLVRAGRYEEAMSTFSGIINEESHTYREDAIRAEARVLQVHPNE